MKQKIKVKVLTEGCEPSIITKGDWIDLKSAIDVILDSPEAHMLKKTGNERSRRVHFNSCYIPLGVAMQLPKGMEAHIVARSSIYKNFKVFIPNSVGIIDNSYNGNNDQWMLPVIALDNTSIKQFSRVCQFRIIPSQKATFWQKLKWFLSNGIELEFVDRLNDKNRGGIGSTGV